MTSPILAVMAVVPMITGPLPEGASNTITAELCGGGTITLDLGGDQNEPKRDCHQKGCHAANCRPRPKRGNLI